MRSEKMGAVLSRLTADENALRAAQFKEEDMKDQAETTLEVLATALLNLVHHGAFAQVWLNPVRAPPPRVAATLSC